MLTFLLSWAAVTAVLWVWNQDTPIPYIKNTCQRRSFYLIALPWGYLLWLLFFLLVLFEELVKAVKRTVEEQSAGVFEHRACWRGKP